MNKLQLAEENMGTAWEEYIALMQSRPELFQQSKELEILLDPRIVRSWEAEHDQTIGVVYKSKFNMLIVDLVSTGAGEPFAYERLVQSSVGKGVVSIPVYKGRFILLRQYRHAMRCHQYSFPRGYGEDGLAGLENTKKELVEELHADLGRVEYVGTVVANSGVSGDRVEVFLCEVTAYDTAVGHEEITNSIELAPDELRQWIADQRIDDGFTLSAWALLSAKEDDRHA